MLALLALLAILALVGAACKGGGIEQGQGNDSETAPTATATATATAAQAQTPNPPPAIPSTPPTPSPVPTSAIENAVVPEPEASPSPSPTPAAPPSPSPTQVPISVATTQSSLEAVDCPSGVAAEQVTCSVATLPLDATNPIPGEVVKLFTAFVDNGDPSDAGPVVFLQGGPGVGSIQNAQNFVGGAHDVLFVDQRGTGYSEPKLDCPELDDQWQARHSDDDTIRISDQDQIIAAYQSCRDRLSDQGISFEHFHTTAAATDIELLRQLLGFEQWSLWGISYGTRVGLTVMRDHPAGVRSAVLDSVVPFEVDFFATIPEHGWRAILALDAACDATECANDHGDFVDNLSAVVIDLNAEPVVVTASRSGSNEQFPFRVDGDQMLDFVFTQLYSTRAIRSLPRQVARAEFGGIEELVASYMTRRDPNSFDLSAGLYYTTWCREEFPFYDSTADDALLEELEPLLQDSADEAFSSDGIDELCAIFEVPPSPVIDNEPLLSEIPTLVFAGVFDPITPPAWSKQVADALVNATYVEMPDHGHGMATTCPANLRLAFFIDPLASLDTACAQATAGPVFE